MSRHQLLFIIFNSDWHFEMSSVSVALLPRLYCRHHMQPNPNTNTEANVIAPKIRFLLISFPPHFWLISLIVVVHLLSA